eukprot:jgi/Pico_ML_1/52950/g3583.t2
MAQRRGAAALSAQLRRAFHASGRVQAEVAPSPNGTKAVNEALRPQPSRLEVPSRMLMGPGPSNAYPRVLAAMTLPLLGHLHPPFVKIMDEIKQGLQYLAQTESPYAMAVSGSGHAGMEASIANVLEPGDKIIVGNNGIWGSRVVDLSGRYGAQVISMDKEGGQTYSLEEITAAIEKHKPQALFLCQGESSSGTMQNLEGIGEVCKANNCLLIVDTVCTFAGVPFYFDNWGVDVMYSGSQKALSCPPGAAPFIMSENAMRKLKNRKTPPATYNLDMNLIGAYWGWFGNQRFYHHTGPVSQFYALREGIDIACEEGLENLWARHQAMHEYLWEGLNGLGLKPFVENPADRLPTVNTIKVPEGVDFAKLIANAMDFYSLEIAGGLGPTVGKVWRIGVMGHNARPLNIDMVIQAFRKGLEQQGKL